MSNAERIAKRPEAFLDWQRVSTGSVLSDIMHVLDRMVFQVKRRVEEEEELQQKHSQKGET
jgi:hypothetical protein